LIRSDIVYPAFFSPLLLPIVWLTLITVGYTGIYGALGGETLYDAFLLSGSSLLTLGFAPVDNLIQMLLAFSEATIGLIMVPLAPIFRRCIVLLPNERLQ
jgi:hypothetical protein